MLDRAFRPFDSHSSNCSFCKPSAQQTQGVWFYGEDFREATDVRRRSGGPVWASRSVGSARRVHEPLEESICGNGRIYGIIGLANDRLNGPLSDRTGRNPADPDETWATPYAWKSAVFFGPKICDANVWQAGSVDYQRANTGQWKVNAGRLLPEGQSPFASSNQPGGVSLMITANAVPQAGTMHHLTVNGIRRCIENVGYIPRQRNVSYDYSDQGAEYHSQPLVRVLPILQS